MAGKPLPALSPTRVHAVLRAHLHAATDALERARQPSDEAVHEARKALKRARASLRLLRPIVGDEAYRRENAALRDAARPLSPLRDAAVVEKALAEVLQQARAAGSLAPLRGRSLHGGRVARRHALDARMLAGIGQALEASAARIAGWHLDEESARERVHDAIERLWRKGRKALRQARAEDSAEARHEARKQVKYLELGLEALQASGKDARKTKRLARILDKARAIEEDLGHDRDFALLRERLLDVPARKQADAAALIAVIEERQRDLRKRALAQGRKLYKEKDSRLRAQIARRATCDSSAD